jgi:hypothetical protein
MGSMGRRAHDQGLGGLHYHVHVRSHSWPSSLPDRSDGEGGRPGLSDPPHARRAPAATAVRTRPASSWIVVPDFPVPKHAKTSLQDVTLNGGLHMQGIALLPPASRLNAGLDRHFAAHQALYVRSGFPLCRLHAEAILQTPEIATEYVLKSIRRGRVSGDQILLLPDNLNE